MKKYLIVTVRVNLYGRKMAFKTCVHEFDMNLGADKYSFACIALKKKALIDAQKEYPWLEFSVNHSWATARDINKFGKIDFAKLALEMLSQPDHDATPELKKALIKEALELLNEDETEERIQVEIRSNTESRFTYVNPDSTIDHIISWYGDNDDVAVVDGCFVTDRSKTLRDLGCKINCVVNLIKKSANA